MGDRPLVVGVDARELAGRPTGTGRYLRNLLRHWRDGGDRLVVYFNGPPALDPVLDHPAIRKRPLGDGAARGLWLAGAPRPARRAGRRARRLLLPGLLLPAVAPPAEGDRGPRPVLLRAPAGLPLRRRLPPPPAGGPVPACVPPRSRLLRLHAPRAGEAVPRSSPTRAVHVPARARRRPARPAGPRGRPGPARPPGTVRDHGRRRPEPALRARAAARRRAPRPSPPRPRPGRRRRESHPPAASTCLSSPPRSARAALSASPASSRTTPWPTATPPPTPPCSSPSTRVSAFPRSRPRPAACRWSWRGTRRSARSSSDAALLVNPRDETAVAAALHRVLSDARLRDRLVVAGRELARRHSWADTAQRTRAVLAEAAAG